MLFTVDMDSDEFFVHVYCRSAHWWSITLLTMKLKWWRSALLASGVYFYSDQTHTIYWRSLMTIICLYKLEEEGERTITSVQFYVTFTVSQFREEYLKCFSPTKLSIAWLWIAYVDIQNCTFLHVPFAYCPKNLFKFKSYCTTYYARAFTNIVQWLWNSHPQNSVNHIKATHKTNLFLNWFYFIVVFMYLLCFALI